MKIKNSFFYFCVAFLTACSASDENIVSYSENNPEFKSNSISVQQALKTAESLFNSLETIETRASTRRVESIESVDLSQAIMTRSEICLPDTVLYLINYTNEQGFVLMGADKRLEPIYAFSETGSLNISDTTYNKGLALFIRNVSMDISQKITYSESAKTRATIPDVDGNINSPYQISNIKMEYKRGPYGKSRLWSQGSPFNKYCYTTSNQQAPVGCVAVATGLIMAYHQYPAQIEGYNLNWGEMNKVGNGLNSTSTVGTDDVARLLSCLGRSKYLMMNYGVNSSGANSNRVPVTLRTLGYTCGSLEAYNKDKIVTHYTNSTTPVYMRGNAGKDASGNYINGHAWIIDGALNIWLQYIMQGGRRMETNAIYFYCNWGWRGTANGWYQHYNFKTTNGPELVEKGDNFTDGSYDFDYNIEMIVDIHK